jgi:hypothetical protein
MKANSKNKHWIIFGIVVSLSGLIWGGVSLYEYYRIKKLNATVVTPDEAKSILQQGLSSN